MKRRKTQPKVVTPPSVTAEPQLDVAEQELIRSTAVAIAQSTPGALMGSCARALCVRALDRYWKVLHPQFAMRQPPDDDGFQLTAHALGAADALGGAAARMTLDQAAYYLGSSYSAMLPARYRASHGVYYTPPALVERLLDTAELAGVDWMTASVLDPACGGGAFLAPVARRMLRLIRDADPRIALRNVMSRLEGQELDPFAGWVSSVFLDALLLGELGVADTGHSFVTVCDSLSHSGDRKFDLVVGNPPYGRIRLNPAFRERYKRSLFGHANLYGLFLDLAFQRVRGSGVVAFVVPTGFLSGEYFKNLRRVLLQEGRVDRLEFIDARAGVFDGVLQETVLATFRADHETTRGVRTGFLNIGDGPLEVQAGPAFPLPAQSDAAWVLPRSAELVPVAGMLRRRSARLRDWGYRVSTGPLVWNRHKDRLRTQPTEGAVPLLWAECVTASGEFEFRAARRNHAPYFDAVGASAALLVTKECVLLQRTTSKEQARRLVAAELPGAFLAQWGAVAVENHLNMLMPLDGIPSVPASTLAAFLNSSAADAAFRCISGTVAVSSYELSQMPLPSPCAAHKLTALLRKSPSRDEVDAMCWALLEE